MALSQWKEAILEGISIEIEEEVVEEKNLERLENLVEILHKEGSQVPESVKEAYCQVAVECTARYLAYEGDARKEAYIEAISTIWIRRIMPLCDKVSCLVTRDLLNSCRRLWKAHNDEKACKDLKNDNTKEKALVSLKRVVSELHPNLDEYTHESEEIEEDSEETDKTEPMVDSTEVEVNNQHSEDSEAVDEEDQDTELERASGEETESPLRQIKSISTPVVERMLRDLRAAKTNLVNALEERRPSNLSSEMMITEQENNVDIPVSTNSEPRIISLMERRSTAQTYEWKDSIDNDSEGEIRDDGETSNGSKRKRIVTSPLKSPEKARKAKARVPWSTAETLAVLKGYEMYGPNWKRIKEECPILDRRTNGDIKDKYRVEMRRKERHC